MANNIELASASGGAILAADDISSVWWPYSKIAFGGEDTANIVTSTSSNPFPVALSDVDNAVLDTINTAVEAVQAAVEGTLTVGSHAVTNAGTFATQATLQAGTAEIGKLAAGVAEIGNVKNSGTFAVQVDGAALTSLQLIDNAVSGAGFNITQFGGAAVPIGAGVEATAVRVTLPTDGTGVVGLTGNLPDTSAGDLAAINAALAGTLTVTGGGGGTEYTEDVATANPIVGTATLIERDDALTTVTPVEGDWIGLRGTAEVALWVQDFNSDAILVDTGTIAGDTTSIDGKITACDTGAVVVASGTVTANLSATDNAVLDDIAAKTSDPTVATLGTTTYTETTTKGVTIGAVRNDTLAALANTDNEIAPLQVNATGALYVAVDGTVTVDGSGVTQPVSGTVTANLSATDNAVLDTIDAVLDTINAKLVTGTVIGDVNLGATDNAVLDSIVTNTTGLAGTVSGSELQVDVVAALPTGSNTIGAVNVAASPSIEDANNTTAATLGISGVFTGTSTETLNYKNITVIIFADESSAAGGVSLQWSGDGTNWDHTATYSYTASSDFSIGASVRGRYFRIVYTNGTTGQGAFRLFTFMHPIETAHNIRPLEYTLDAANSATVTRSVISGKTSGGNYINIGSTAGGNLKTSITEISDGLDIGAGNAGGETQRVSISTDDVNLSAVKTSVELLDNAVSGAGFNITQFGGASVPIGAGTEAASLRVTLATDSTGVVSIDDNSGSITVDNGGTFAVQSTLQAGSALVGNVGIDQTTPGTTNAVNVAAIATGGATPGKLISAATTNATSVKGSAATLYSLQVFNTNAAARYLKIYNKATAPTVGTDTPVLVFTVPGNTAGAGLVVPIPTCGIALGTGFAFATTTGAADSDTAAVAANEIVVSYSYK